MKTPLFCRYPTERRSAECAPPEWVVVVVVVVGVSGLVRRRRKKEKRLRGFEFCALDLTRRVRADSLAYNVRRRFQFVVAEVS